MDIDVNALINGLVTTLLGGGLFLAVAALRTARTGAREARVQERRLEEKDPLELAGIALDGSENAMLMMEKVNERLAAENERLREETHRKDEENERLRNRVTTLEANVDSMANQLLAAHELAGQLASTLSTLQQQYDATRQELDALRP